MSQRFALNICQKNLIEQLPSDVKIVEVYTTILRFRDNNNEKKETDKRSTLEHIFKESIVLGQKYKRNVKIDGCLDLPAKANKLKVKLDWPY